MGILEDVMLVVERLGLTAVVLGGTALPAYNVFRTTLDIDICVSFPEQESLSKFITDIGKKGYQTRQNPNLSHWLFTIFGHNSEAEIWLQPCDAFEWDEEMKNRVKLAVNILDHFYILSVEDYILTKLARDDKSGTDILDVIQILLKNYESMDWRYFAYRLNQNDQISSMQSILDDAMELDEKDDKEIVSIFERIKKNLEPELRKY